ncbi:MAG: UDP-4-amino-4,6-dideoxy-N-acetyl-beta-L-altrosamine transaminase [Candidatus Wildermuthbacteria bacterium RIFCSPHIGHO2_01_FULL_49_22b]|uniref:UDP-4-amino-4, 6-dideoxy-N-acetyl-beta-L-altrosamine transaminase n=1 Tax=Candidatus Wildermuthbacteria bacterium RIFCSPHIGHO2_01_FULL_49_22b TaxID=1802448 RepID=A0A1G2R165_9BACT|nr:MAG: UDP-4-amino-4,6-dideoxy-N-acetyl-beta-L-altrosamine transaminase [Candidatus Wildermuthbacteria bacterium RIFCSPHIGHO2_01_FULL_49_22b]
MQRVSRIKKYLPYGHQWIDQEDVRAVVKILRSEWLTQGPLVEEFENAVAKYCGARYALAVSSGTAALHVAYFAAGIQKGDEVIMSPLTFAATANTAVFLGAKPVFADIKEDTLNIDPAEAEKRITKKTKVIMAVDFAGRPCEYKELSRIARKHKLVLMADAAHSLGATYKGKKVGQLADITTLSFHPVKAITTGEGGMVLTNNRKFAEKARRFRNHGIERKPGKRGWYYEIAEPGLNYRITDIQCALGLSQLKKLNGFLRRRRELARQYRGLLKGVKGLILPTVAREAQSAWHLYPVQIAKGAARRKEVFDKLRQQGIGVQVHYMPLHLHPFYKRKFGYKRGDFPNAERYYDRALSIPLFPAMTNLQQKHVVQALINLL